MIAHELIDNSILPLRTSDTGDFALSIMNEFCIRHLPIVNLEQLLGVVSEEDILNSDVREAVGSYNLSLKKPYIDDGDHILEVMKVMAQFSLTVVPVTKDDDSYAGLITQEALLQYFARSYSFENSGSIVILEMAMADYSLAHLSQIVESENASILSSFLTSSPDNSMYSITLKINKKDITSILAAFRRYEYKVAASFADDESIDLLKERYDMLMTYLNV